jgi:high-affinity iron transporter
MGGTFVITLREGFEAALLVGLVYTYLDKIGARQHFGYVTVGAVLGAVASVLLGVIVTLFSGPLIDLGPDAIAAGVLLIAAGVLTWHGWWMRQHARELRGDLERQIDAARAQQRFWIVGAIAFTGVFREGAETVLFLWGLLVQAAGGDSGWHLAAGAALGVAGAIALGVIIFRGARRLSVRRFFTVTSVLLLFLAAGLFSAGVGRLQGLGVLPQEAPVWDTSEWLDDRSFVGSLLAGLLGYRARPSSTEIIAYVGFLILAGWVLFAPSRRSSSEPLPRPGRSPTPSR